MTATKEQDLWSGRPLWRERTHNVPPGEFLRADAEADAVIVGAGIVGALVADSLAERGLSVIILDRRPPAAGSTAASTALLLHEIDTPLVQLAPRIGEEKAVRAWQRSRRALANLEARLSEAAPGLWRRRDSLYLAGDTLDPDGLREEQAARKRAGLESQLVDGGALEREWGIQGAAALRSEGNLEIDPVEIAGAFLARAQRHGARLYTPVTAENVTPASGGIELSTAAGPVIRARQAIWATGYEVFKAIPGKLYKITSSWVIATKPQPRSLWPGRAHVWEASDPYLYVRTDGEGRVICGGEDEEFSDAARREEMMPRKIETLRRKLAARLPGIDTEPEFAWAGCFGETPDSLPLIGAVPGLPNCHAVLAFGGNGTTFAQIAAEIIDAALAGKHDEDADLFSFAADA